MRFESWKLHTITYLQKLTFQALAFHQLSHSYLCLDPYQGTKKPIERVNVATRANVFSLWVLYEIKTKLLRKLWNTLWRFNLMCTAATTQ